MNSSYKFFDEGTNSCILAGGGKFVLDHSDALHIEKLCENIEFSFAGNMLPVTS